MSEVVLIPRHLAMSWVKWTGRPLNQQQCTGEITASKEQAFSFLMFLQQDMVRAMSNPVTLAQSQEKATHV